MRVLGLSPVARAVRAIASVRGHGLALVYHRVTADRPGCIIPTVDQQVFERQLEALADVASIVDLGALERSERSMNGSANRLSRPPVALTFDDDLPTHVTNVLPSLRRVHATATFFLSGRALVDEGAYWFQRLEAVIDAFGSAHVAAELGSEDDAPSALVRAAEHDRATRERLEGLAREVEDPPVLGADGIRALCGARMSIGFHTIDHVPLPALDDAGLEGTLHRGRRELRDAVGRDVDRFAYPHGAVDQRVMAAVRAAGFMSAWTGSPTAVRDGDDAYTLGRWEPGPLSVDAFLVRLAVRLHRRRPRTRGVR